MTHKFRRLVGATALVAVATAPMQSNAGKRNPDLGNVFASFMVMNKTTRTCTIHMLDPRKRYLPEQAGHELNHCIFGSFHPSR